MRKIRLPQKFAVYVLIILISSAYSTAQNSDRKRIIDNPAASVRPNPTPTPFPNKINDARLPKIQNYVRSRVNGILLNPLLRRGRVGVRIDWLDKNTTIFARNADKYFMPASNMKSYTVAAALDSLTPNFRFVTSVYANSKPDENGSVTGSLVVFGRGDPSISSNFNDDDLYKGIDNLAEKIVQSGVKNIQGGIVGDETYFNSKPVPYGWEWDDLQWYYGAEISPLSVNDNAVQLRILPGMDGSQCIVNISPVNRQFRIVNLCRTSPNATQRKIRVKKKLDQNLVEVTGTMPEDDRGYKGNITISRPAKLFVELLRQRLQLKGVRVSGPTRLVNRDERNGMMLNAEELTEIAKLESLPLSVIAAKTMKPSQNLYTELILRTLGEERGDKTDLEKTSAQKGIEVVQSLLRRAGASPESVIQYDGSGLSRHNLITPNSAVMLYRYMDRSINKFAWRNALTIGGVDGTLKRRFRGTSAVSNIRGKTGTLDQVSALTGYVSAKSGESFVFSILTNNLPDSRLRTSTIDDIVVALADFDSRDVDKKKEDPATSVRP